MKKVNSLDNFDFSIGVQQVYQTGSKSYSDSVSTLNSIESDIFNSFKFEKRKCEWMAGRIASKMAYFEFCRKFNLSALRNVTILNDGNRVPYIMEFPDLQLSITHSHKFAIAALSRKRIGIDIESINSGSPILIKYFFTDNESRIILNKSNSNCQLNAAITKYWTRKEALSKFLKLGMKMNFRLLDTIDDYIYREENNKLPIKLKSYKFDDYYLSIAV